MQLRFQKIKGMEVLAEKEGKLLGSIRRIQIDSSRKVVLGLVFKARAIASEQWINASSVTRVGEDVIFVTDAQAIQKGGPAGRDVKDMLGLSVTSLDGKRLGALNDIVIDTEKWAVAALVLDNGGEVEVSPKGVFGEDTILLEKGAVHKLRKSESEQSGFLTRVFNSEGSGKAANSKKTSKSKSDRKKS